MAETQDITQTGPVGLSGVRNTDLYPKKYLSDEEMEELQRDYAASQALNRSIARGNMGYSALDKESLYSPLIDQSLDYGSSTYDLGILVNATQQDIANLRFSNLSAVVQAVNGIVKGAILAGTTFISGTAGLIAGIGLGIANALSDDENVHWYEGIWNNPIIQAMHQINQISEEVFVNYRSEELINGPWYSSDNLLSANFIFDTVVKNMGFVVGAAWSGGVYAKAIGWAAKALGTLKAAKTTAQTIEAGAKAMQNLRATKVTKSVVGSYFSAQAEAVQEAYNTSQDFIRIKNQEIDSRVVELKDLAMLDFISSGGKFLDDGTPDPLSSPEAYNAYQQKLAKIDEASSAARDEALLQSKKVGTMDGLLNMPILFMDNIFMFGKFFAGGWQASRNTYKGTVKASKETYRKAVEAARAGDRTKLNEIKKLVRKAEKTGFQGMSDAEKAMVEIAAPHLLGTKAGVVLSAVKGPLREGNEEMAQGAAAQAATYRYSEEVDRIFDAKMDIESTHKVKGFWESIVHGIVSQYGDFDNYEEAFVGAITGLLGSPTFGRGNNSTDQTYLGKRKMIGLTGGTITNVRDFLNKRKRQEEAARAATKAMRDGNLGENLKHLIAQTRFQDDMKRAVIHDDEKEYKDARTAAAFELISHLRKVGRLDLLQRAMEATAQFTDEDIAELISMTQRLIDTPGSDLHLLLQRYDLIRREDGAAWREKLSAERAANLARSEEEAIQQLIEEVRHNIFLTEELKETTIANLLRSLLEKLEYNRFFYDEYLRAQERLKKSTELVRAIELQFEAQKNATASPYVHRDSTVYTADEVREDLKKRVDNFGRIIQLINNAQDEIDNATAEALTDELLTTLTWYRVMMDDWEVRAKGITTEWKDILERVSEDPTFVELARAWEELAPELKDKKKNKKARVRLGGVYQIAKNASGIRKSIASILNAINLGGIEFAQILAISKKNEQTNKAIGEEITEFIKLVIQMDNQTTLETKENFIKALNDLVAIGKAHNRFNELMKEYLTDPNKIDQAHRTSERRAENRTTRQSITRVIDNMDWSAPAGTIAIYIRDHQSEIDSAGGTQALRENLNPQQKRKLKQAEKLLMAVDSFDQEIDEGNLTNTQARVLRSTIDDALRDAEEVEDFISAVREILNEELGDRLREFVSEELLGDITDEEAAAAEALDDFMNDISDDIIQSVEEAEAALEAELEELARLADVISEDDRDQGDPEHLLEEGDAQSEMDEDELDYEPEDPNDEPDSSLESERGEEPDLEEVFDEDEETDEPSEPEPPGSRRSDDAPAGVNPTTSASQKRYNKKVVSAPQAGKPGDFSRRRLVSQYYLHGLDRMTTPQYYEEHPENIPAGVDKEAFLKYIKAVHKYLVEKGAYTYISGANPEYKLKKGDTIYFTTDEALNEEAGVKIILMVVKNKDGQYQVVGSLPTSIDFQAKKRGSKKTVGESNPLDKALYDSLVEELTSSAKTQFENTANRILENLDREEEGSSIPYDIDKIISELKELVSEDQISDDNLFRAGRLLDKLLDLILLSRSISNEAQNLSLVSHLSNIIARKFDKLGWNNSDTTNISYLSTYVESLMGGNPSFSATNRTVSEVFGEESIPITIISRNARTSEAVTDPIEIIETIDGQVYVYVTSRATGKQIPLLCVSTPLKNVLNPNDWYTQLIIAVMQGITSTNMATKVNELFKWLPFLDNLHINQSPNDSAQILIGWGTNEEGKIANSFTINVEDGVPSASDIMKFLKKVANTKVTTPSGEEMYPTTSINHNRLRDKEYMSHASKYLWINVTADSPFTVDDWFTYAPVGPQKLNRRPSNRPNPAMPPERAPQREPIRVSPSAIEVKPEERFPSPTASKQKKTFDDQLSDSEESQLLVPESSEQPTLKEINNPFGAGIAMPDVDERRLKRKKRGPRAKPLLVSDTEDEVASRKQVEVDAKKVEAMFPQLAKQGRVVLVRGLLHIVDDKGNPREAYGLFKNGVLYISDQSPKGTAFHEAFHYIADTLLSDNEKAVMFEEASKLYGNLSEIQLEELLAESFREFMNKRQDTSLKGRLKNIFSNLKHIVLSLVGRESYMDSLFWNIYRNKMQDRKENIAEDTFKQELLVYKNRKLKYQNLSQETRDYLNSRHISEQEYEDLSIEQKEIVLLCI